MFRLTDPLEGHNTVAVLGLGSSGRAACRLLGLLGKSVIASDANSAASGEFGAHVTLRLGGNDFAGATAAVISPGLNPEWPENRNNPALEPLWAAVESGAVVLWSEVELAIACAALPTLTVGGTDGKSTTAAMVRDLATAGGETVLFGGNSWTALSDVLADHVEAGTSPTVCVAEVSAFQLWKGHRLHPRIALLTNIAPDHLDHYSGEDAYVAAKCHIFEHLGAGDHAVLFADDARLPALRGGLQARGVAVHGYALDAPAAEDAFGPWQRRAWLDQTSDGTDGPTLCVANGDFRYRVPANRLKVPGSHNRKNALAALLGVRELVANPKRLEPALVGKTLEAFRGLPHRLEPVRERHGVLWLNDSKATNIHAAVTGLGSLDRPVVAIVGGVDKALELAPMFEALDAVAHHVVIIGALAERFGAEMGARTWGYEVAQSMEAAIQAADAAANPGDAVVLSPGCSSFDMFKSFEHRGDVFTDAVMALS